MRHRNRKPLVFWVAITALTAVLAGLAFANVTLPGENAPSASPAPSRTGTPPPSPSAPLLSDARGFVARSGGTSTSFLRRETDMAPLAVLRAREFVGAATTTGRRVAYWVTSAEGTRELRVFDASAPAQDATIAVLPEAERGTGLRWSTDRSGLVVSVGPASGDRSFSALRVVDTPTRTVREIARLTDGDQYVPVGWDRDTQIAAACIASADGRATTYSVVSEDGEVDDTPMEPGIPARTVQDGPAGVLAVLKDAVVRVWTLGSYDDHHELAPDGGEPLRFVRWRGNSAEIVVAIADRLELWPGAGGEHRVVARGLPAASGLLVSADGALAFVSDEFGQVVAVDLGSGTTVPVPNAGEQLLAAVSFR